MTSPFHTSLTAMTAPGSGVDLGVRVDRLGRSAVSMWGYAGRRAFAGAANDIDALAARSAG